MFYSKFEMSCGIFCEVFCEIISYPCSTWVIMNRETRRLCKIPEQVREEVQPFYLNRLAIAAAAQNHNEKIDKLTDETAGRIRSGLAVSLKFEFINTLDDGDDDDECLFPFYKFHAFFSYYQFYEEIIQL